MNWHAIVTPEEMYLAEAAIMEAGTPGYVLMQRAGVSVADILHGNHPSGRVRVLCGPGGNGGDGFVAARRLVELGRQVDVYSLVTVSNLSGDDAQAAADWDGPIEPLEAAIGSSHSLTLDALLGGGLARPLEGVPATLAIEPGIVISVDVPSGINGLTGQSEGANFTATETVTFAALRPAHVLAPGRAASGEIHVVDIGVPVPGDISLNTPACWQAKLKWPDATSHKHARGHLLVATGGLSSTGAARLAARAGLRVGAGLVTLLCPPSATLAVASRITAEMVTAVDSPDAMAAEAEEADAAVVGPAAGVTDRTRENVLAVLGASASAVLDADALTVFQDDPSELFEVLRPGDVLTPHPGEFRRLFPGILGDTANLIEAAQLAAREAGCTVLLKGGSTVIAAASGEARVNTHASPWLATAGSGDVLAGLIGGLLAQGIPGFEAACAGAWIHGECGLRLGPGLIATDLEAEVPGVLRMLSAAQTA